MLFAYALKDVHNLTGAYEIVGYCVSDGLGVTKIYSVKETKDYAAKFGCSTKTVTLPNKVKVTRIKFEDGNDINNIFVGLEFLKTHAQFMTEDALKCFKKQLKVDCI